MIEWYYMPTMQNYLMKELGVFSFYVFSEFENEAIRRTMENSEVYQAIINNSEDWYTINLQSAFHYLPIEEEHHDILGSR